LTLRAGRCQREAAAALLHPRCPHVASRLARQGEALLELRLAGKCNGATGTFSALLAAFPDEDWVGVCEAFVRGLGLEVNPITTQIEDHDRWADLLDRVRKDLFVREEGECRFVDPAFRLWLAAVVRGRR